MDAVWNLTVCQDQACIAIMNSGVLDNKISMDFGALGIPSDLGLLVAASS